MDERQPQAEPQLRGRPLAPTKRQREHQHHCHHLGPLENHRRIMILHFLSSYWFIRFRFLRREDTVHKNIAMIWDVLYSSEVAAEWATAEAAADCKVEVAEWATAETTAVCRVEAGSRW